VHSFCIDKKKRPSYLLVVGNPQNKEFFNPIAPNTIAMIGLGNLASLIENALNNVIHYQQLIEERKTLEIKVRERTEDLGRALKDLKKLNAKLHYLSYKDELTGLYNRRGFFTVGEKYFNMAKRKNTEMLVVFCDLNRFKDINDSYGHKEGDEALKQTAMILKTAFRNYDIVSRFGGDEFVLLLDNTTASDFQSLKKRLDTALAAYNDSSGKKYRISISYGFSSFKYDRNPALTFDDLLDEADKMLYAEKRKKPEFAKRPRHSKRPVKMPTP
jgi:diguanylate cyclase (GGDEF)-like protein